MKNSNTGPTKLPRRFRGAIAALGLILVAGAPSADAARAPEPAPSIALVTPDPYFGGKVTFKTSISSKIKHPMILVRCYQGTTKVYAEAGLTTWTFHLGGGSSMWVSIGGGAARCASDLYYNVEQPRPAQIVLSTTWFDARA